MTGQAKATRLGSTLRERERATPAPKKYRIPRGRDAAVTLSALAEMNGCSRREVEAFIQQARLNGTPICTGPEGVWRAETPQEARDMANRLRSRAIHQMETAQALERAADEQEAGVQQETLWAA